MNNIEKAFNIMNTPRFFDSESRLPLLLRHCQRTVADFVLGYDDFEGRWYAEGVYLCGGGQPAYGESAEEALANLVVNYDKWLTEMKHDVE